MKFTNSAPLFIATLFLVESTGAAARASRGLRHKKCNTASTGYEWCESTRQCYRPWEEDCPSTQTSSSNRCNSGSTGYQWCKSTHQCYRPWEEDCPIKPTRVPYTCDGAGNSMRRNMRLYPGGWLCGSDSYGVEQALGLSTDGQLEFYYNKEKVFSPPQRGNGSYVALNNNGQLQVYGNDDQVVGISGCGRYENDMIPNLVTLSNDGGFALAYQNGGILKYTWSVNHEGQQTACNSN